MNKNITIDEMRQIQLKILKSIHQFCINNNIRYSLSGGSLIGAVRHKGYIPWDDDIDLMMPRPDYERFVNSYKTEHYKVQTYKNDDKYWYPFGKVYDNRTVLIESHIKSGVYIDIFPIDGMPNEKMTKEIIEKRISLVFKNIYYASKVYQFQQGNKILLKLKYYIKKTLVPKRETSIQKLEEMCLAYPFETSDFAGVLVGGYGIKERMEKTVFLNYVDMPFEGMICKCIEDYDTYLSHLYGDYMTLPPVEKRVSNHTNKVFWK